MKRLFVTLFLQLLALGLLFAGSSHQHHTFPAKVDTSYFNGNRIFSFMDSFGSVISSKVTGYGGLLWPKENPVTVGYCSGLGLAGKVDGDIRIAWIEYSSDFSSGPFQKDPVNVDSSVARIFKIKNDETGDWESWPWYYGAPVVKAKSGADSLNQYGQRIPLLMGDQTLWMVINDLDEERHYFSKPMGVEVQITVWGYDDISPWSDMMFVKWKIINKSETTIEDAYITLYLDYDIGDASTDRVGCDTTLSLGYGYSGKYDMNFHPAPPGFGFVLLQGPLVPAPGETGMLFGEARQDFKNLPMTSFIGSG